MSSEQLAIYQHCTGRSAPPTQRATEAWFVCGRRAGKSFTLALCAIFLAFEVHPVSMRTTRGYTIVAALCDEIAFWPHEDAAEPDYEVLNALRGRPGTEMPHFDK